MNIMVPEASFSRKMGGFSSRMRRARRGFALMGAQSGLPDGIRIHGKFADRAVIFAFTSPATGLFSTQHPKRNAITPMPKRPLTLIALIVVCLAGGPAAAETVPLHKVAMRAHSAGTYYIPGVIEGHGELEFLVDTGSSYPVIPADMLTKLKAQGRAEFSRNLNGRMADGSRRTVPLYRLTALRLGDACWVRDVEVAIFPAGARPILGMSTLGRLMPFTFSAEPPELGLSHCELTTAAVSVKALEQDAMAN